MSNFHSKHLSGQPLMMVCCTVTYLVTRSHSDFPLCAVQSPEKRQRTQIERKYLPGNISKLAEGKSGGIMKELDKRINYSLNSVP